MELAVEFVAPPDLVVPLLDLVGVPPPLEVTLDCRHYFPPEENPDCAARLRRNSKFLDFVGN